MLNYNPAIKENKNYNDLIIKEIAPIMKLNIRGKKREFFTSVGKILNMILPTAEINSLFLPLIINFIIGLISSIWRSCNKVFLGSAWL